jgi:hypothetical protein
MELGKPSLENISRILINPESGTVLKNVYAKFQVQSMLYLKDRKIKKSYKKRIKIQHPMLFCLFFSLFHDL